MRIFKKKKAEPTGFFEEESNEARFNAMVELTKDLSASDFKQLKKAMDKAYEAYQIMRGLDSDDDNNNDIEKAGEFMLADEEVK